MKVFFSLLVTFPMVWVLLSLYIPSGSTLGRLASPFTINLIDEKELSLKDLRKNVVFLNFWASWCTPCKAEAKGLEAAWRKSKKRDVVFLCGAYIIALHFKKVHFFQCKDNVIIKYSKCRKVVMELH